MEFPFEEQLSSPLHAITDGGSSLDSRAATMSRTRMRRKMRTGRKRVAGVEVRKTSEVFVPSLSFVLFHIVITVVVI